TVPTTALVPGDATVVIHVPDCAAARKALVDSDFGKLIAEPDVQAFIKPAWDEVLKLYAGQRQRIPVLPDLDDIGKTLTGGLTIVLSPPAAAGPPRIAAAIRIGDLQAATRILQFAVQGKELAEGQGVLLGPPGT